MDTEERQENGADTASLNRSERRIDSHVTIGPSFFQLLLVAVLVTALFMGPIALLQQIEPSGPWQMMPALALLTAFESVLTRRWLDWPARRRDRPFYSLAEVAFLLVLTPVFLWLASGELPLPSSLAAMLANPFSLITLELGLYMLLVVVVWERAHSWSGLFIALSITPDEVNYHTATSSERFDDRSIVLPLTQRKVLLQSFLKGWIVGGILLVTFAALATFDVRSVVQLADAQGGVRTVTRLGMSPQMLIALMVYFVVGLLLISQGRMVILNGRWLAERCQQDSGIASTWRRWTLALLGGLALLASFMPIGDSFVLYRIMQAIAGLLTVLVRLALVIVTAAFTLILLLIHAVISLFPNATAQPPPTSDFGDLLPSSPPPPLEASNVQAALAGSAFWLTIVAVAILATLHFLRDRGPGVDPNNLQRLWRRLTSWLMAFWRDAAEKTLALSPRLPWRIRRPSVGQGQLSRFRFLRVNALPPRAQIRFLYLALVRQTAKRGLRRTPAATPTEFAEKLNLRWPDSEADVEALTGAFLEARYSDHKLDGRRLKEAKDAWIRIRRSLGGRSRNAPS